MWCLQLAELRPQTPAAKARVSLWALVLTSALFLLITIGSYLVFGPEVQSDVLHNYTPHQLEPFLGKAYGTALYIIVRISFLVSVLGLFPIMVGRPVTGKIYYCDMQGYACKQGAMMQCSSLQMLLRRK